MNSLFAFQNVHFGTYGAHFNHAPVGLWRAISPLIHMIVNGYTFLIMSRPCSPSLLVSFALHLGYLYSTQFTLAPPIRCQETGGRMYGHTDSEPAPFDEYILQTYTGTVQDFV
jgi:hypothetical protein